MNFHVEFAANEHGRDFVVGDIHGMLREFEAALKSFGFDKKVDRCFSVGDLIDRGPNSMDCLQLIYEPWFHAVQGNHEQLMLRALLGDHNYMSLWIMNGGGWVRQAMEDPRLLAAVAEDVSKLPFAMTLTSNNGDKIGICHAESPVSDWSEIAAVENDERLCQKMIWGRSVINSKEDHFTEGVLFTIHGHTIIAEPAAVGNALFIDTGSFLTGNITLIDLDTFTLKQEEAA